MTHIEKTLQLKYPPLAIFYAQDVPKGVEKSREILAEDKEQAIRIVCPYELNTLGKIAGRNFFWKVQQK